MIGSMTYDEVTTSAQKLKTCALNMEDILNKVKKDMDNRMNTDDTFKSASAASIKDKFDELSTKFYAFSAKIQKFSETLDTVVETYKAADNAVDNDGQGLAS